MALYPQYIAKGNSIGAISDDGGNEYNNCHFWSNFEIADMDFWRSDAYMDYFNFLDKKGGFYCESQRTRLTFFRSLQLDHELTCG